MILTITSRVLLTLVSVAAVVALPSYRRVEAQSQRDNRALRMHEIKELPAKSKRFALVIGVDEYHDGQISRLSGAGNDAKALADALVRYSGFPADQVILLASDQPQQRQPNRGNILQYPSNLRSIVPEDGLLVVSFASHGVEPGGRGFLCPSDARIGGSIALLESTGVAVDTAREWIRETGVKQVLIILDAFRNDPSGRGVEENRLTDSFARRFNFDVRNKEVTAFATLYATDVGHVAYDYKEKKQGYFTWTLVEGLKGGAASEKGEVTLGGLVRYLQDHVPKRVRLDMGQEKSQKPYATGGGYKVIRTLEAAAKPVSPATNSPPANSGNTQPGSSSANREEHVEVQTYTETAGGVGIEMLRVPSGKFLMGSPGGTGEPDEHPQHEVTVSSFWMGKNEVTQAQWRAVSRLPKVGMDLNPEPSYFKGEDRPVEQVNWDDAVEFCARLTQATGKTYRLPTEAEWEYACRASTRGDYAGDLDEMAWYTDNSAKATHPVGRKRPNGFGLYDMHGNVWEWCRDWYSENYYSQSASEDPRGPGGGSLRVVRGGTWAYDAHVCRSASRSWIPPGLRSYAFGFRVVVGVRTP